jgi:hypothetical protein
MGGVFWFLLGMRPSGQSILNISLSGIFFIGAIGSRITLLPGVLMLGVLGITQLFRDDHTLAKILELFIRRYSVYYGLILVGLILFGWYNHARFGNIFEFGHRYQLTSWGMENSYKDFFSWRNVLPNFINYSLRGFRSISVFPFIKPEWGVAGVPVFRASAVTNYHAEQITGILTTTPIIMMGFIPIYRGIQSVWDTLDNPDLSLRTLWDRFVSFEGIVVYVGVFFLTLALSLPLGLVSFNTMRYLFDISLSVSILSTIGFGLTLQSEKVSVVNKGLITFMVLILSLYTATIGLLLGITSYEARFEHINPQLFDQITRLFAY